MRTVPIRLAALLLAVPLACAQQDRDPVAEYRTLNRALNQAAKDKDAAARRDVVRRGLAIAAEYQGKDEAVRFLTFVVKNGFDDADAVTQALATLTKDHAANAAIAQALPFAERAVMMHPKAPVRPLLDAVLATNGDAECKALAHFARGRLQLVPGADAATRAAGKKDLETAATLTQDEDLKAQAAATIFEAEHLQVGCTAPEIEGTDTDGKPFRLSEYRGKVVLLDFWGFW